MALHHPTDRGGSDHPLFKLNSPAPRGPLSRGLYSRTAGALERLLAVDRLNDVYARVAGDERGAAGPFEFIRRVLDDLHVRFHLPPEDLARVPRTGPLVVVSNHPFGALDGMVLAAVLGSVRPDVKVMANYLLGRIPELRDLFLFVDPFGGTGATAGNVATARRALRWLKSGGVLAAFPAGEVAHLRWGNLRPGDRRVADAPWGDAVARIARLAGAPVLPVFFDGRNGPLFHALGLLHPRLRTAMLARELFRMRGACVELRVGSVIPPKRVAAIAGDAEVTGYLRRRTLLLGEGAPRGAVRLPPPPAPRPAGAEPVIEAVAPELLAAEVSALPADALLVDGGDTRVYHARAPRIRHLLREIGRLREVTFRAAGEGTNTSIDLDTFDYDYVHLFVWNQPKREVVGAYRLGATDELLPAKGRLGLYTSTLFNYGAGLIARIDPALEMGRSFVRGEYQKSYAPLLMLWKGISAYVVRHPRYRNLFGPVSISNNYQTVSRHLMVQFLKLHHALPGAAGLVSPRRRFRLRPPRGWDDAFARRLVTDSDEVSDLVADLEPDQKGMPVLLRQYLRLGAKFLDFNVDPAFSDALDGLIVVDLLKTEPRVLEKYMGREGYTSFVAHHTAKAAQGAPAAPAAQVHKPARALA